MVYAVDASAGSEGISRRIGRSPLSTSLAATSVVVLVLAGCSQNEQVGGNQFALVGGPVGAHYLAIDAPKPEYPEGSLHSRRQGLVVAEIELDSNGNLSELNILDSPDRDMSCAVEDAVRRWRFRRIGRGIRARGRLFFYFKLVDNNGFVFTPEELKDRITMDP
jgi:TonB family protein